MKKRFFPLLVLMFFSAHLLAQYSKVKTLTHRAYYKGSYLVEVDKSNDKINVFHLDRDMTAALSISPWLPTGYSLDTVFFNNGLQGSADRFIYGATKGSSKQVLVCDEQGKFVQQFINGQDVRLVNTGAAEKVIVRKLSSGTWSSEVYELDNGKLSLEKSYPTEWLGAFWYDFDSYGDEDYWHYFYIDKANNEVKEFDVNHNSLSSTKFTVPSGYQVRAWTESIFRYWLDQDYRPEFVVYFENNGSYMAKLVNGLREIQTFQNCRNINRYRTTDGSRADYILTSDVSTSSKTSWEFYSIENSKTVNIATKEKTVRGEPIARNWAYAADDGFVLMDNVDKKLSYYDTDFTENTSATLDFNVSSTDDIRWWTLYYDGNTDGNGSTQELFCLYKKSNGTYEFKISRGTTDLLTVQNARDFETAPYFINPGKMQVAVWIPGTGTELYELDFSIGIIDRVGPKDKAIDQPYPNVTLNWKGDKNALRYEVEIRDDSLRWTLSVMETVSDTFFEWDGADSNKTYYWRVAGINDATGGANPKKLWWEFKTLDERARTPALVSPVDDAKDLGTTVELVWNSSKNAVDYEYEYSTSSIFSTSSKGIISDTKQTLTGLDNDETYYWRVRAIGKLGKSAWSDVWSFTTKKPSLVAAPTLVSPNNKTTGQATSPTLTCSNVTGAIQYTFQWSESASFSALQQATSTTVSTTAVGLKALTEYYWRAKVETAAGESDWSDVWSFTTADLIKIDAPDLVSPTNQATGLSINPNLVCSGVADAVQYTFEWDTNNQFTSSTSASESIALTALTSLDMSTTYYWRVKVQTTNGISDWSDVWSFTTADEKVLDAPTLLLPATNSTGIDPSNATFEWTKVSGATSYEVQVATDVNFDTYTTGSPTGESLTLTALAENTIYYWRVRADDGSLRSEWSKIFTMTTGIIGNVGNVPFPTLSIFPNPVDDRLFIELEEKQTNHHYQVQIFNAQGKTLFDKQFTSIEEQGISVRHLDAGIYLLKVSTTNKSQIMRFVKE